MIPGKSLSQFDAMFREECGFFPGLLGVLLREAEWRR